MNKIDDFFLQQTFTDTALRVDAGFYPDDRGPNQNAVRLLDARTGILVVEIHDVSLTGAPAFGRGGVVTLMLTHYSDTPVSVRIDTHTQTCAFHPLQEEPLADLNTWLASFWEPPRIPPSFQAPPSQEAPAKCAAVLSLIAFAGVALYAVGRWHWSGASFWLTYGLGFAGMLITVLLFTLRHTFTRR